MRGAAKTILLAGLLAGTLDGLAACVDFVLRTGRSPVRVFQFIASGVFGAGAFSGGNAMAAWGVLFHYLIATSWAAAFVLAYPRLARVNAIVLGLLYGVVVWLVMNLVVLPLSNVPQSSPTAFGVAKGMVILMVCVGLPIALVARRGRGRGRAS